MNHLRTILAALLLAAAPAAGQTIKTLGYNTTNGNVVAARTNLTFTNSLVDFQNIAIQDFEINFSTISWGGTPKIDAEQNFLQGGNWTVYGALGFNNTTNAAITRTNLGLGATNNVTFNIVSTIQLEDSGQAKIDVDDMFLVNTNAAGNAAFDWGGPTLAAGLPISFSDATNAAITRTNLGLGATNNVTFNELTVKSLTTTDPVGWALDAVQTAAATNGVLTLPDAANVLRITNANAISSVTNGRLGAFYYLVNQTTNNLTISNAGGITVQGGTPLTLGANQAATLVATGPTNASVAARGDLNDVTLGGTANTAPNQTASSGSSLMTRDLGDARYGGPFYYAIAKTNVSVTNSTNLVTVASVTLPTGWYHFEAFWRSVVSSGGTISQRLWNKSGTTSFGTVVHYIQIGTTTHSGVTRSSAFETNANTYRLYGFVNITSAAELVIEFAQTAATTNTATIYSGAGMIFRRLE